MYLINIQAEINTSMRLKITRAVMIISVHSLKQNGI